MSRRDLRNMLSPGGLLLPGVSNALAARVVADQGFAAAYVTGAGIANTFFGVPDIGLVTADRACRARGGDPRGISGALVDRCRYRLRQCAEHGSNGRAARARGR